MGVSWSSSKGWIFRLLWPSAHSEAVPARSLYRQEHIKKPRWKSPRLVMLLTSRKNISRWGFLESDIRDWILGFLNVFQIFDGFVEVKQLVFIEGFEIVAFKENSVLHFG